MRLRPDRCSVVSLAALLWLASFAAAAALPPALRLSIDGAPLTVFSHTSEGCDAADVPDAPARAIRTASGMVELYATQLTNRRLVGPDLRHLHQDCRIVYQGADNDDPAAFDDRIWIASLFTQGGQVIDAIGHEEFWGQKRPGLCPVASYEDCVYNALVALRSTDGGLSFHRRAGAGALIAALPTRYEATAGHHVGYFNPTGIVTLHGMQFVMTHATDAIDQRHGNCLLRTGNPDDPTAWRGWDGTGFTVRFVDPYAGTIPPGVHVCEPVGAGRLRWPVTALLRHRPSGLFIAIMLDGSHDGGIEYATSPDLLSWSEPSRLMAATGPGAWRCGDLRDPIFYPSLLDPDATDPSFATVGDHPLLFMTRLNPTRCHLWMDRDLVAIPVRVDGGAG